MNCLVYCYFLIITLVVGDKAVLKNSQFGYKITSWKNKIEKQYLLRNCDNNILQSDIECVNMLKGDINACFKNERLLNVSDRKDKDHYWIFNPDGYFLGEETEIENPSFKDNFLRYCKHENCLNFIKLDDNYYVHSSNKETTTTCDVIIQNMKTEGFSFPQTINEQECIENTNFDEKEPGWLKDAIHLNKNHFLKRLIKKNVHEVSKSTQKNLRVHIV